MIHTVDRQIVTDDVQTEVHQTPQYQDLYPEASKGCKMRCYDHDIQVIRCTTCDGTQGMFPVGPGATASACLGSVWDKIGSIR